MLFIAAVLVIAVAVALLRGSRLNNVSEIRLRAWWLLLVGLALQAIAGFLPDDRSWSRDVGVGLILASFVALIVVVTLNRGLEGMWLASLGILMNFAVIAANQGMPVLPEAAVIAGADSPDLVLDAKHVILDTDSRLPFLADVIPVPFFDQVISLGDIFLAVGLGQYLESQLRQPVRWFKHGPRGEPGSAARNASGRWPLGR